VRMWKRWRFKS